jgi:hypothetical protein
MGLSVFVDNAKQRGGGDNPMSAGFGNRNVFLVMKENFF